MISILYCSNHDDKNKVGNLPTAFTAEIIDIITVSNIHVILLTTIIITKKFKTSII